MGRLILEGLRVQLSGSGITYESSEREGWATRVTIGDIVVLPAEGEKDFQAQIMDNHVTKTLPDEPSCKCSPSCEGCTSS